MQVSPERQRPTVGPSASFADVLRELLRPPYVWWLLLAMALQAYTPLYIAPVAAVVAAVTVGFARQAVQSRGPVPVRQSAG